MGGQKNPNLVKIVCERPLRVNSFLKEHCDFYVPAYILTYELYFHEIHTSSKNTGLL